MVHAPDPGCRLIVMNGRMSCGSWPNGLGGTGTLRTAAKIGRMFSETSMKRFITHLALVRAGLRGNDKSRAIVISVVIRGEGAERRGKREASQHDGGRAMAGCFLVLDEAGDVEFVPSG